MRWEYTTLKLEPRVYQDGKLDHPELLHRLNELGEAGWELGSAFDTNQSHGDSREIVVIFKRQKH